VLRLIYGAQPRLNDYRPFVNYQRPPSASKSLALHFDHGLEARLLIQRTEQPPRARLCRRHL